MPTQITLYIQEFKREVDITIAPDGGGGNGDEFGNDDNSLSPSPQSGAPDGGDGHNSSPPSPPSGTMLISTSLLNSLPNEVVIVVGGGGGGDGDGDTSPNEVVIVGDGDGDGDTSPNEVVVVGGDGARGDDLGGVDVGTCRNPFMGLPVEGISIDASSQHSKNVQLNVDLCDSQLYRLSNTCPIKGVTVEYIDANKLILDEMYSTVTPFIGQVLESLYNWESQRSTFNRTFFERCDEASVEIPSTGKPIKGFLNVHRTQESIGDVPMFAGILTPINSASVQIKWVLGFKIQYLELLDSESYDLISSGNEIIGCYIESTTKGTLTSPLYSLFLILTLPPIPRRMDTSCKLTGFYKRY